MTPSNRETNPKLIEINTVDDVANFAKTLVFDFHFNFNPDTPFGELTDDPVLASVLDKLMDRCFEVCEAEDVSIYGVMGWPDEKPYANAKGEGGPENKTVDCIVYQS